MSPFKFVIPFLLSLCLAHFVCAQDVTDDYSFFRNPSTPVFSDGDSLTNAWGGGINGIRLSEIDLDQDGNKDLFAFEKHGNRVLTFLRRGDKYLFAPEYARRFPELHDWAILQDYDNDGKPDIFTYGLAGIRVFHNISDTQLEFELVTDQLQAFYYNGYVNIYASPDDYIVVEDVDGDGHVDILNFWVLGKYVHYLRNYATQPGQFDFRLESECWGHFEEAADGNAITLFSDCGEKSDDGHTRHVGSSMLLHDFDDNGLPDILVGDIDAPNLAMLYNHGTGEEARMTMMDTLFPAGAPVHLYSMPAPSLVQLSGQVRPSLIASPSDPALAKSQDLNSVWRYDFDTTLQQYTLVNTAFLQEDMIDMGSGSHPVFFDWDGDGLLDLFVANYGSFDSANVVNGFVQSSFSSSIRYYHNVGSSQQPAFELADDDFGHLKELNIKALHPSFGSFYGDSRTDMVCGQEDGTLLLIPHERIASESDFFIENYQEIDVGKYSTPTLFDLDYDRRTDLIIGNQEGKLYYYRNITACSPHRFELITDNLGQVDVCDHEQSYFGYSVPCFYSDTLNGTVLFCGSDRGYVFCYKNIDNNLYGTFTLSGVVWDNEDETCQHCAIPFKDGRRVAPAIAHLDEDAYPDLIAGNYAGGLTYLKGRAPANHPAGISEHTYSPATLSPNPTNGPIDIDYPDGEVKTVIVYNLAGQILARYGSRHLDISHLPDGLYILEINHSYRTKLIKSTH